MIKVEDFFVEWPFSVVPNENEILIWAGRPSVLKQIEILIQGFQLRPNSTLDMVWASFGSGKTHLLYYLKQSLNQKKDNLSWYCTVPRNARTFLDVYSSFMQSFPFDRYISFVIPKLIQQEDLEILSVLRGLSIGTQEQKAIAIDWLRGFHINLITSRRLLPIPYRIDTTYNAERIFFQIIKSIVLTGMRLVIMLDEFQRIRGYHKIAKDVLNSSILDAFNHIPKKLSIIYSCSTIQQSEAYNSLSPELIDRMKGRLPIQLPILSANEALEFISDLIKMHRPTDYQGPALSPFDEKILKTMIDKMCDSDHFQLTPRQIIQVLDQSLGLAINEQDERIKEKHILMALEFIGSPSDVPE